MCVNNTNVVYLLISSVCMIRLSFFHVALDSDIVVERRRSRKRRYDEIINLVFTQNKETICFTLLMTVHYYQGFLKKFSLERFGQKCFPLDRTNKKIEKYTE